MASIEASLVYRLKNYAGLSALVSTRVYTMNAVQAVTLPYVTLFRVSADRVPAMGSDTGIVRARFQVSAWGDEYADAKNAAIQVRAALQRYRATVQSVEILDIFVIGEQDFYEKDTLLYQSAHDFDVIYRE